MNIHIQKNLAVVSIICLLLTMQAKCAFSTEVVVEKYLESEKKDYTPDEVVAVRTNPSGTKLVISATNSVYSAQINQLQVVNIEGLPTPGIVPTTNQQTTLVSDFKDAPEDRFFMSDFISDSELAIFTQPDSSAPFMNVGDVQANSLSVTKKNPEKKLEFNSASTNINAFSTDQKNGLFVAGNNNAMILDSGTMTPRKFLRSSSGMLRFDIREESNWIFAMISSGMEIIDHTLIKDGDSGDLSLYSETKFGTPTDFVQGDLNRNRGLVFIYGGATYGTFVYFDFLDPFSNEFILLGNGPAIFNAKYFPSSMASEAITDSHFFLSIMQLDPAGFIYRNAVLIDTSFVPEHPKFMYKISLALVDDQIIQHLATDVKFPRLLAITKLRPNENIFAFTVGHGPTKADQTKDFASFIVVNFRRNCHENCETCLQVFNKDSCYTCKDGYELTPNGNFNNGRVLGSCNKQGENNGEEDGEEGAGDNEISLKYPIVALCGQSKILGCSQCSLFHPGKCATCSNQLGLSGYNSDHSAGDKCVDCPIDRCSKCEMAPGDSERKCTSCLNGKKLMMVDGNQFCFKELHKYSFLLLAMLALLIFRL